MARQRKLSPERKAFIDSLLDHYQPRDAQAYDYYKNDIIFYLKCKHFVIFQIVLNALINNHQLNWLYL